MTSRPAARVGRAVGISDPWINPHQNPAGWSGRERLALQSIAAPIMKAKHTKPAMRTRIWPHRPVKDEGFARVMSRVFVIHYHVFTGPQQAS